MAGKKCLVDTSVWIEHFRTPQKELIELLQLHLVATHSSVLGELACGFIPSRHLFLSDLMLLPQVEEATFSETMQFIENKKLYGKGLSWIDMQLLASCLISNTELLTYDKKLKTTFNKL